MKFLILMLLTASSMATVWQTQRDWTWQDEEDYAEWMQSSATNKDMFVSKTSKWYGISADCADASYGLRIIYSYENGLPFAIRNPSGSRGKNATISNDTNRFDRHGSDVKKVIAFINYIGLSVGTENLSYNDTYPTAISSINPGTLYTYKIKSRNGYVRHSYNIKDISAIGTFRLIYATQAIKREKLPLRDTWDKTFVNLPHGVWGFKRFIWPGYHLKKMSEYPSEWNASKEQFSLVSKQGKKFFNHVQKTLSTSTELPEDKLNRMFNGLCDEAVSRIKYVAQGVKFKESKRNKCMNYTDYDIYSTPARDKALKGAFTNLKTLLLEVDQLAGSTKFELARSIFDSQRTQSDKDDLLKLCAISYKANTSIDLGELWDRLSAGKLSSHPNDILEVRWGEKTTPKTKCKRWY
ncbi:MAG: hypothetical protein BM556_17635 [Bacteriovorax sp. MedPE-SWde]|nr:MAG: hypothetical protein BM556_17635 [Bacteriovorax sp. MedPE-SWde]